MGVNPLDFQTTQTISRKRSGQIVVFAAACPQATAAGTVITYTLYRDGTVLLPPQKETSQAGASRHEPAALMWIDQLTDTAPHTYMIRVSSAAGTLSDDVGHDQIVAYER